MKIPIVILWLICLVSSLTDWMQVESRPAYVPGRPLANMKAFARECVAREIGTVKPIKWLKMLDLRQGHIPKTMKVTFTDFSSKSVNFIKCLAELQANANKNETNEANQCTDIKSENEYLKSLIAGFAVNQSPSQIDAPPLFVSTTSIPETSSYKPPTTCPTHPTDSSLENCQFVKAENVILKQHLENCQSFPQTCDSLPSTDVPSTIHTTSSTVYVWFGFFIGFFVGCLFVIFVNSPTWKKMKNTCCRRKKTIEEREREMNEVTNKTDTKKGKKREEKKKDETKEEKTIEKNPTDKKTETNPTSIKKQQEEINWEEKNKLKKELNKRNPPPRQKKIAPLDNVNLIDLSLKEEKINNETNKISKEENKIGQEEKKVIVDSVAIMIESV